MTAPLDFPPINASERPFTGPEHMAEVSLLAALWLDTEEALIELSSDPQLLLAIGAGDPDGIETQARRIRRATQEELQTLRRNSEVWAAAAVSARFGAGFQASVEAAEAQGLTPEFVTGYELSNAQSVSLLVDDVLIDVEFSASSAEQTINRFLRRAQQQAVTVEAVTRSLAISDARLENLDQRTTRLVREFEQATGHGKFVNIRGRRFTLENYARVVARTRLAESASQGAFHAILALGGDHVQISDHGATDPACDAHAGKVYSISGRDSRFPRLTALPPFHPNCQHVVLPYIPDMKRPVELQFAMARSRDEIGPGVSLQQFLRG